MSDAIAPLDHPKPLELATPLPLTQHPAAVYLSALGAGSRRTMREALNATIPCQRHESAGVWGYAEFLEAIQQPDHPEHESMLEWVGGTFDPDAFILSEVNQLSKADCW